MTGPFTADSLANLELVDFKGQSYTFADWRGQQNLVLVFTRGFF